MGFALTFTGCEREQATDLITPSETEELVQSAALSPGEVDVSQIVPQHVDFTKFGIEARQELYGYYAAYEADELVTYGNPSAVPNLEKQIDDMESYVQTGLLTAQDVRLLRKFAEYTKTFTFQPDEATSSVRARYREWISAHSITPANNPILYHAFTAAEELLFETQVSAALAENPGLDEQKSNDDNYCTVSGFLCTADNNTFANIVRTVIRTGIAAIFRSSVDWTSQEEILGNINLGNLAESAVGAATGIVLTSWWDRVFCNVECDNCAAAIGAVAVFDVNGCDFIGIRLIGNFEFADRFEVFIDDNLDGVFEGPFVIFEPTTDLITAQQIGNLGSSSFAFRVEVICDGGVSFPWAGPPGGLFFDLDNLDFPRPTASINTPPRNSFYYPSFTPLTFSTFAVATRGWTFNNWSAGGGTPSTGGSLNSFTTSFNDNNPITRGISLSWSHPCEPNYNMPGASFLICSPSVCN